MVLFTFLVFSNMYAAEKCSVDALSTYKDCADSMQIFIDNNNAYSLSKPPSNNLFLPAQRTSLGNQFYPVWSKLILQNDSKKTKEILLVNPRAGMDEIAILVYRNNHLIKREVLGDIVPMESKSFYHRYSAVELSLDPSEEVVILARLKNNVFLETSWCAISKSTFAQYSDYDLMAWSFYYGLLFVLIFYSINNYFLFKSKVFLLYSLIAISSALQISSYNGFAYIMSSYTVFNNLLMWIFLPLTTVFMLLFGRYFFVTQDTMPKIDKIISFIVYFLIITTVILSISYLFYDDAYAVFIMKKYLSIGIFLYLFPVIIGISAIVKKLKGAVFYTIGQGVHSVSIAYLGFYNAIAPTFSFTTLYAPLIGSMIDLIFLSFALVQYFKYLKYNNARNEKILVAQSAFSNIGKSIGHITHQWRHPIALIGGSLALLESIFRHKNELFLETFEKQLPDLKRYIKSLENTLNDFSSFYASEYSNKEYFPLSSINNATHLLRSKIILKNVSLTLDIPEDIKLYGQENIFSNIMLILIDNSLDAFQSNHGNTISIIINKNENFTTVLYEDNAGGIAITPIEKVFDYFVTTKNDDAPHGFGLAIAKLLIEDRMDGTISVENTASGVFFKITLKSDKVTR